MNPEEQSVQKKISLDDYGEFVSVYRGNGTISIIDVTGEKPHPCSFEAGQKTRKKLFQSFAIIFHNRLHIKLVLFF
jgi:hypothetical protein